MNRLSKWLPLVFLILAVVYPFTISDSYTLTLLAMSFIWTIAVYGMNLIAGYTGQLSLAQAGFFGIGAYTYGVLTLKLGVNTIVALLAAIVLTGCIGFLVGLISLRTKGHYFTIFTLCVGVILSLILEKWESVTEGVRGLIGIPGLSVGSFTFDSYVSQYYLILFCLVLSVFVSKRILHSLFGRTLQSVRNSEDLAEALGVNVMRTKILSFALSTMYAGLAGGLYSIMIRFIGPDISVIDHTFDMLLYLIVGGIGTFWGPLVGTLLVTILTQWMQFLAEYRMVIFGPLLVILVMFLPHGIMGSIAKRQMQRNLRKMEQATIAAGDSKRVGRQLDA
ncbi:branched-chain amino acid ABC transporter permease [Effusibacillus dendaii]|uniref:Branched-chain amino acid ABC transporter permease n=1 Tax=Effusibacillus dendaii TaxID=2743772 RepID=A0A7I8D9F6_9BACL|nr:branched-chain amino acid ABC transporter permease [Effusibacillus dendaii]BCJ85456.1 branched-chain amino acid ABC transporter permease [Effusibacillus dendaii]